MGACDSSGAVQTKGGMQPGMMPDPNMKWDGRACDYVCPAPYEQVIKHIQFNTMPNMGVEAKMVASFTSTGNTANSKRDISFASGTKLEETCTFAQENGHGYLISKGGEQMEMPGYRGTILAFRIPGCADKCLVTFSCIYMTKNQAKTGAIVDGFLKMYKMMFEEKLPMKIMGGGAAMGGKKVEVEYFAMGYGRADPIRMLLGLKKIDYEYVGHTFESWGALKGSGKGGEFNGLPRVRAPNGMEYGQSLAILRSLGAKNGLYDAADWRSAAYVDTILDAWVDMLNKSSECVFAMEADPKGTMEKHAKVIENVHVPALKVMEA